MLGTGIFIVLKMLLPILLLVFAISAALKALRGYENKSKRKLEMERKKQLSCKRLLRNKMRV